MKSKLNKNLKDLILAIGISGTLASSAVGWMIYDFYKTNQLKEQYSKLPVLESILEKGKGPISLTAKYVDTDLYTIYIRMPIFKKENPKYAENSKCDGYFKVHYDPEYCRRKKINIK